MAPLLIVWFPNSPTARFLFSCHSFICHGEVAISNASIMGCLPIPYLFAIANFFTTFQSTFTYPGLAMVGVVRFGPQTEPSYKLVPRAHASWDWKAQQSGRGNPRFWAVPGQEPPPAPAQPFRVWIPVGAEVWTETFWYRNNSPYLWDGYLPEPELAMTNNSSGCVEPKDAIDARKNIGEKKRKNR